MGLNKKKNVRTHTRKGTTETSQWQNRSWIITITALFGSKGNLQFYGLVPHDDVSRQNEGLDVDDVCVPTLCSHVQPFTLKGKVAERDPGEQETEGKRTVRMVTTAGILQGTVQTLAQTHWAPPVAVHLCYYRIHIQTVYMHPKFLFHIMSNKNWERSFNWSNIFPHF